MCQRNNGQYAALVVDRIQRLSRRYIKPDGTFDFKQAGFATAERYVQCGIDYLRRAGFASTANLVGHLWYGEYLDPRC